MSSRTIAEYVEWVILCQRQFQDFLSKSTFDPEKVFHENF